VNPQVDGAGVPDGKAVGTGVARGVAGVAFALPENIEVHPAATRTTASRTIQIPGMINGRFMADLICCDIRSLLYLWIYLTAVFLEVLVFHNSTLMGSSIAERC